MNQRVMQGKPHVVRRQQETSARPSEGLRADLLVGADDFFQLTNEHKQLVSGVCGRRKTCPPSLGKAILPDVTRRTLHKTEALFQFFGRNGERSEYLQDLILGARCLDDDTKLERTSRNLPRDARITEGHTLDQAAALVKSIMLGCQLREGVLHDGGLASDLGRQRVVGPV